MQLTIRDSSGNSIVPYVSISKYLLYCIEVTRQAELPFLVAHLSLYSGDGTSLDMGSSIGRDHAPPILYGNLVSSVDQLEDLQGNLGLFFLFPDVSIRWRGQYQLGISLLRICRHVPELITQNRSDESPRSPDTTAGSSTTRESTKLAETRTHIFNVVDQAEYTAARKWRCRDVQGPTH